VVEYFTKWIEVKPLVNIATVGHKRFFSQNITCHFKVPMKITIDNAKKFDCNIFKEFYHQMGVEAAFTSMYHPQSNGAVEKANALIFSTVKIILEDQSKGK
jgi:IS30 family transposase